MLPWAETLQGTWLKFSSEQVLCCVEAIICFTPLVIMQPNFISCLSSLQVGKKLANYSLTFQVVRPMLWSKAENSGTSNTNLHCPGCN